MSQNEDKCAICQHLLRDPAHPDEPLTTLACAHTYHEYCVQTYAEVKGVSVDALRCPQCHLGRHDIAQLEARLAGDSMLAYSDEIVEIFDDTLAAPLSELLQLFKAESKAGAASAEAKPARSAPRGPPPKAKAAAAKIAPKGQPPKAKGAAAEIAPEGPPPKAEGAAAEIAPEGPPPKAKGAAAEIAPKAPPPKAKGKAAGIAPKAPKAKSGAAETAEIVPKIGLAGQDLPKAPPPKATGKAPSKAKAGAKMKVKSTAKLSAPPKPKAEQNAPAPSQPDAATPVVGHADGDGERAAPAGASTEDESPKAKTSAAVGESALVLAVPQPHHGGSGADSLFCAEVRCYSCGNFAHFSKCKIISKGKQHWKCSACATKSTQLYRGLGQWPTPAFQQLTDEERQTFMRNIQGMSAKDAVAAAREEFQKFEEHGE